MQAVKRPATKKRAAQEASLAPSTISSTAPTASSTPTTIELRGVPIHFPFKPYDCQETYMGTLLDALHKGENALLESPTGTGKTLCLLCATLAWQRQQARSLPQNSQLQNETATLSSQAATTESKPNRVPTVIYASRTHSQLSQVVRELRNTRYRPKHAVLGSREQMCVNPKVKKANATASDINYDCNKLCKDRKCRFRNNLDGFVAPRNESFQHYQVQPVMDMEDLVTMGTAQKVCPFYYTRSLVSQAELILVPYNYLFDKDAREGTLAEVPWDNAVLIFDEAHNLESFASESASFDLSSGDIASCLGEINRVMNYVQAMPELGERISLDNLARLKAMFLNLEEHMMQRMPDDERVYSGEKMMEIFRDGMSITYANHAIFLNEVRKLDEITMEMRSGASKGNPKLDAFTSCIKRVYGESSEARCLAKCRVYRVHVSPKDKNGRTISYWCFAPSLAMQELSDLNVRSIIVTSGTLSPLPSYSLELGLPFLHTVENPHIIADNQIHVRVVGHGVSGKVLNSSFERRGNEEYLAELGNTLVSLARIVPGGMLVFFPSYGVMETCVERWGGPSRKFRPNENRGGKFFQARRKSTSSHQYSFPHSPSYGSSSGSSNTPWKRLLANKAVILEPKTTSELPDAIADFHKYLGMPKSTGCVLMGVCRGKISEGIDFAHDMCRAVVITGIPFAPYLDPKVKLKREYLDSQRASQSVRPTGDGGFGCESTGQAKPHPLTLSGAEWYTQQAHRAVNQAVGRVIRNKSDYGAVLLLDSRFGDERNQQGLSKWVRPHIQNDEGFGKSYAGLTKFYREAQKKAAEIKKKDCPAPIRAGVLLQYENDNVATEPTSTKDSTMTKIDVVQNVSNADLKDSSIDTAFISSERVIAHMELNPEGMARGPTDQSLLQSTTRPDSIENTLAAVYQNGDSTVGRSRPKALSSGDNSSSAWSNLQAPRKDSSSYISTNVEARRALRETTGNVKPRAKSKTQDTSPAVLFFEKVRACCSKDEMSLIKASIFGMKKHGDKKDVESYLRAADSVLSILTRYENFDNAKGKSGMLDLFFLLLPKARQSEVERSCLNMNIQQSQFLKSCKVVMEDAEYKRMVDRVIPSLIIIHSVLPNARDLPSRRDAFLRDCKPIFEMLENHGSVKIDQINMSLADLFLRLVPERFLSPTQALLNNMASFVKVEKLKSLEKARIGEDSIEAFRFNKPKVLKLAPVAKSEPNLNLSPDEALEAQTTMEAALMRAQELNKAKREKIEKTKDEKISDGLLKNPCNSGQGITSKVKREGTSSSSKQTKVFFNPQQPKKPRLVTGSESTKFISSIAAAAVSQKKSNGFHDMSSDPIAQCLNQVESDSYVKRAFGVTREDRRKINSNAPAGLKCSLCESKSKRVSPKHMYARLFTNCLIYFFYVGSPFSIFEQTVDILLARIVGSSGYQCPRRVQLVEFRRRRNLLPLWYLKKHLGLERLQCHKSVLRPMIVMTTPRISR
jgi:regulator of telomere elongation helicase 1